jgi:hypothetical protein
MDIKSKINQGTALVEVTLKACAFKVDIMSKINQGTALKLILHIYIDMSL